MNKTLCLLVDSQKIFLSQRDGKWGGLEEEIKENEEATEGAKRNLWEELGIQVKAIDLKGIINFEYPEENVEVYIFKVSDYNGSIIENKGQWFDVLEIPFEQMRPVDLYWLPLFLKDKNFKGRFVFTGRNDIINHKLEVLND